MANNKNKELKLKVENLTVSFRTTQGMVRAVRDVSFDLHEGETLAIVGESGSGKSVTSRTIMGILAGNGVIDKGSIMYEGQDLTKIAEEDFHRIRGDKIGMIFQDPLSSLNPIMRIGKQITEGMRINGHRLKDRYNKILHRPKMEINLAKEAIKREKFALKEEKKELKANGKEDQIPNVVELHQTEIQNLKAKLQVAKDEYKKLKPDAKATIKQEWQDEKARVNKLIEDRKDAYAKETESIKDTQQKALAGSTDDNAKEQANIKFKQQMKKAKTEYKKDMDQLKEGLRRFKKVTKREATERALQVMDEVGIPQPRRRLKQYPFQFSGGMRQRIVIAIALTANPDVLICDEPTTALDVTIQAQILDLIKKLKEERSLSVIFITHDLGVVANMADRVAVMYAGKIVEIGSANEIFYNPKHPYTWALLGSMPDLESTERLNAIPGTPPNMLYPPKGDAFADRNPYALKIDFEQIPPMFKVNDDHYAATWLLHKHAPKVDMPPIVAERIKRMKNQDNAPKEVSN